MHMIFFFFNDTATTEIYTLSLHDALPISPDISDGDAANPTAWSSGQSPPGSPGRTGGSCVRHPQSTTRDRKSTRLNSSHANISYAVFCLKKKKQSKRHCTQVQDIRPHTVS